jgi:MFS family permease
LGGSTLIARPLCREQDVDASDNSGKTIETRVPARLDQLPFGRFHILVIVALGITWVLDGLEVTLVGSIAGALVASPRLRFTPADVGIASSAYLLGAVVGSLFFGWLTDRLGRKKLFFITLALYCVATAATAFSFDLISFCICRFLTGAGIGGEYSAINSTIQELIPARMRGHTDLAINGSFWLGGAAGAFASIFLLDPAHVDPEFGWRLAFFIGAVLGLGILLLRIFIPESPRWLAIHGREEEAEKIVDGIETQFREEGIAIPDESHLKPMRLVSRTHTSIPEVLYTLFVVYRKRAFVGLALMAAQAFFYNAIFFTYALVLTNFYGVQSQHVGWYVLPFALGNWLGPLLLGPLFDRIGRKPMIAATYIISGLLLALSGLLFAQGRLDATQQTIAWMVIFFFASSAAGSAYLTVSETFPVEVRALAIAIFYAFGTAIGGVGAPALFGALIGTENRMNLFLGYLLGAGLMIFAGIVAAIWGVAAERKSLESVARPLSQSD